MLFATCRRLPSITRCHRVRLGSATSVACRSLHGGQGAPNNRYCECPRRNSVDDVVLVAQANLSCALFNRKPRRSVAMHLLGLLFPVLSNKCLLVFQHFLREGAPGTLERPMKFDCRCWLIFCRIIASSTLRAAAARSVTQARMNSSISIRTSRRMRINA